MARGAAGDDEKTVKDLVRLDRPGGTLRLPLELPLVGTKGTNTTAGQAG
jgi:hypothetical protein